MMIIGVDYHPSFQTIAFLTEEIGECGGRCNTQANPTYIENKGQNRSLWLDQRERCPG